MPRAEGMAWGEVGEMEGIQRQASIVGPVCGQCELNGAQLVGYPFYSALYETSGIRGLC